MVVVGVQVGIAYLLVQALRENNGGTASPPTTWLWQSRPVSAVRSGGISLCKSNATIPTNLPLLPHEKSRLPDQRTNYRLTGDQLRGNRELWSFTSDTRPVIWIGEWQPRCAAPRRGTPHVPSKTSACRAPRESDGSRRTVVPSPPSRYGGDPYGNCILK